MSVIARRRKHTDNCSDLRRHAAALLVCCACVVTGLFALPCLSYADRLYFKNGERWTDVLVIEETETHMLLLMRSGEARRVSRDKVVGHIVDTKTKRNYESPGAARVQLKKNTGSSAPKRRPANAWGRRRPVHAFLDPNGVPVFTNRPQKYDGQEEYEEILRTLEPIRVGRPLSDEQNKILNMALAKASARRDVRRGLTPRADSLINKLIRESADQYGVRPELVKAVIRAESNFKLDAVSRKGAQGLMQLMPRTAKAMRVTNTFDAQLNIAGGTQYLARLLEMFGRDERLALAAYNAGPGRVKKYGDVPPFPETMNYVTRVFRFAEGYKSEFGA